MATRHPVRRDPRSIRLVAGAFACLFAAGCGGEHAASTGPAPAARPASSPVKSETRRDGSDLVDAVLPHLQPRDTTRRPFRPGDWFEEVAGDSVPRFAYRDGSEAGFYELIESVGGGVALLDYDADGRLDLFFTGGGELVGPPIEVRGRPCALFRNEGNWRFADVTETAGLADAGLYTHGASVGDYDGDGFPDLLVAGYGGLRLYRNGQDGTFADVTGPSGLESSLWNVTAAWADVDRDGLSDLYLVTYADCVPDHRRRCPNDRNLRDVCGPTAFGGQRDALWRNRGDGTFEDLTDAAGLTTRHRGLGVVAADLNDDDRIDFFVVNDVNENELYLNGPGLPFREVGELAGVAYSATGEREGSMGVDLGDFDGDGQPDLFYANFSQQDNTLLRKVDREGFLDVTSTTGLAGRSRQWVKFGTGFADFDGDGWLDLFLTNGHVNYQRRDAPYFQPAQLFRNDGGRRYVEVDEQAGSYFDRPHAGRGAAVGDLDDDGAPDLAISHQNDPVSLLRNRLPAPNWVRVSLKGTTSDRDAVGAKVTCRLGDRTLTRWVRGGGGYLSHFDPRVLLPVGKDAAADVTVRWPSGTTETFETLPAGRTHVLVEGRGRPAHEERPTPGADADLGT